MRRGGENRVGRLAVAEMRVVSDVAWGVGEDLRRARPDRRSTSTTSGSSSQATAIASAASRA